MWEDFTLTRTLAFIQILWHQITTYITTHIFSDVTALILLSVFVLALLLALINFIRYKNDKPL